MCALNWSYVQSEFAGKQDEDKEKHLSRTHNWMDTHAFLESVKVQMFCLMLANDVRLQFESLRLISVVWNGLQTQFRQ